MSRFLITRAAQALFTLWAVVTIVFFLTRLTGNPADVYLPLNATQQDRDVIARKLNLDKPTPVQYFTFLHGAVRGDFGESVQTSDGAVDHVMQRMPATLQLGSAGMAIAVFLGVPMGVIAATRHGSWIDHVVRTAAMLGQSVPVFWSGLLAILIFSVGLGWLPSGGTGGLRHLILPAAVLGWFSAAGIMRLTRSAMLDVLQSDYVLLARMKGTPEYLVIWKHALKNAAIPVLSLSVIVFVLMIGGAVITEQVFSWPGVGRLILESIRRKDYPVVQAGVVLLTALYVIGNLVADVIQGILDPTVRS